MSHLLQRLLTVGCLLLVPLGLAPRAAARDVICRVELDRAVLPAATDQTAVIKIALDPPRLDVARRRPPVNLAIVLDRSGSMGGDKLENAKAAAIEALRRLSAEDRFALVIYDHEVQTLVPAMGAGDTGWVEARIRGITSRGSTALYGGVTQGAAEVRKSIEDKRYVNRVILLSDGQANVGPSSPADLGRLGAALIKEGIGVTTVGVGTDYNEDLMTQLSQKSDGNSYFAESAQALPRIFAAELGDVLNVVARKVIIEIECPSGVRPIRLLGREGRIDDNRVEIFLNQLYGGQEKYVLLEVAVPASASGTERELATARCRYEDALTQKLTTAIGKVLARFSAREEEVIRGANAAVQVDVGRNVVAIVKDEAVVLNDAGKRSAAASSMKAKSAELRAIGAKYNNAALLKQAVDVEQAATTLEKEGLDAKARKDYRTDSYQIRNQQLSQ